MLEIGADAFCECKKLREVIFGEESRLEKIGQSCFYSTRIESIVIPKGVEEIRSYAFCRCEMLKEVALEEGSRLKIIG